MLFSGDPISKTLSAAPEFHKHALGTLLQFLEKHVGATLVQPLYKTMFLDLTSLANSLQKSDVIQALSKVPHFYPDEPRMFAWRAETHGEAAGGSSATSERQALISTLAEALERYLWRNDTSTFRRPIIASESAMKSLGRRYVPLRQFAGFTDTQRAQHTQLKVSEETPLLWIQASDGDNHALYVPAQTVSAARHSLVVSREPLVRPIITTGLATGETRENALIAGALEIFERDAFMIMWLNQLTYPRIDIDALGKSHPELQTLISRARQCHLHVEALRMETDVPAHPAFAIITDVAACPEAPFIVGMGCSKNLADAVAHAIQEALRIRIMARMQYTKQNAAEIIPEKIHHAERVPYWLHEHRYERLAFLTKGTVKTFAPAEWENDSPAQYLTRIKKWCMGAGYTFASVNLGVSKKNPTDLRVESVLIPEMQPMHIVEKYQCLGGKRLTEIPKRFGYTPLQKPFTEEPHPFA